ncbi:MAG: hypothetical protein HY763_04155 [Planctomycetes bacterium]|nr:hypothetical protein [Planctomycetota bacterium]
MAERRICVILSVSATLVAACTTVNRYKVLSFFFDGVPPPGATPERGYAAPGRPGEVIAPGGAGEAPPRPTIYTHAPFRENRCGRCHDMETGQLFKSPGDGLCLTCHATVPGDVPYVHGPVAVKDCLFCHHYHVSSYPKLLLADPTATCLQCHDGDDLTPGPHHANLERTTCVACHEPHGGHDRFFLKRGDR